MASVAVCPHCTEHLELPDAAYATARLQCPLCDGEFDFSEAAARELPQAKVLAQQVEVPGEVELEAIAAQPPAAESPVEITAAERLSRLLQSTSDWRPTASSAQLEPAQDSHVTSGAAVSFPTEESEEPSEPAEAATDAQTSAGPSRLDQFLSDLMRQTPEPRTLPGERSPEESLSTHESETSEPFEQECAFNHESSSMSESGVVEELDDGDIVSYEGFEATASDDDASFEYADQPEHAGGSAEFEPELVGDAGSNIDGSAVAFEPRNIPAKRRPSAVRTLVGIVGGGALGILLGGYGLLWLRGPDGDVLGIAEWVPAAWLPAGVSGANDDIAAQLATARSDAEDSSDATGDPKPAPVERTTATEQPERGWRPDAPNATPTRVDRAVAPATAIEPIESNDAMPATTDVAPPAAGDGAAASPITQAPVAVHWPTTPIVGDLRDPRLYSLEELSEALPPAEAAQARFLAGDLSDRDAVAVMGQAYIDLCALAERFTLTDPAAFGNQLITKQLSAKTIFRGVLDSAQRRSDLAVIAARWLQHDRRQNQGILLVGTVHDVIARGRWSEHVIEIDAGEASVQAAVLLEEIEFPIGSAAAIAGVIVSDPRQQIAGYDGNASVAVISGFDVAVAEDGAVPSAEAAR